MVNKNLTFGPDYAIPPGETLKDEMAARGWSLEDLAAAPGCSCAYVMGLLNARLAIGQASAEGLAKAIGTSAKFWLNMQRNYDEALEKSRSDNGTEINNEEAAQDNTRLTDGDGQQPASGGEAAEG